MKIEVIVGDIVKQPDVEAIVNSANANLRLGSGVSGVIHRAAGNCLEEFCRPFAPIELGAALITPGFNLPNPWIIHVRSSNYITNTEPERYMAFALFSVLNTATVNGIRSLALPAIGTGVFKFPPILAARITARVLCEFDKVSKAVDLARICVVREDFRQLYESAIALEKDSCM